MARQRLAWRQRVGLALALTGVVYVIAKGELATLLAVRLNRGDAWIAVASVCWTAYSVLLGHWKSALPPLARLAAIAAGGVVVLLPFTVLEALLVPTPSLGAAGWGLFVVAALVPGLLSYGAYSFLVRELGAARAVLLLYLAPLYGALLAWLILNEPPQPYHALGALLILPSIWLASRR
jgi:drug/metabolite transporter (DMT)-like permease